MLFFIRGWNKIVYQEHIRRTYNDFLKTYKTENSGIKTVNQAFSQLKETKLKTEEVKDEFKNAVISVDKAIEESDRLVKTVKNNPIFSTDLEKEAAENINFLLSKLKGNPGYFRKSRKSNI